MAESEQAAESAEGGKDSKALDEKLVQKVAERVFQLWREEARLTNERRGKNRGR